MEIGRAISKLKSDRSGGPDGLCIEMFKFVIDDIIQFLVLLFNDIYNTTVPSFTKLFYNMSYLML